MKIKNLKLYFPIIGITLFIYILFKVNLISIIKELINVKWYFLLIAILLLIPMLLVQTFKWYIIALFQDIKIPFKEAFRINLIGNFYGLITPSKLGSMIRAEYLKKFIKNKNIGKGLFNFTIDKIFDITSIVFIVILFSFIFKDIIDFHISFFITLFLSFLLVTLFFIKKDRSKIVLSFFYKRFIGEKSKNIAKATFDSFYEDIPKKRYFIIFFILNLICWIFIYLIYYFLGLSLGIKLSFIFYLAILPLATLVSMIPISINGLGTREVTLISLFALFNVDSAKVFSMSVLDYLIVGIFPSIITLFLIWRENFNIIK